MRFHTYVLTCGQAIMMFLYDGTWCQLQHEGNCIQCQQLSIVCIGIPGGYLNLWDIFRFIFRLLRMTFFHKILEAEKNGFSSNA